MPLDGKTTYKVTFSQIEEIQKQVNDKSERNKTKEYREKMRKGNLGMGSSIPFKG